MALLHSLQISGIRNFSPDSHQTVYFNTPVVLFQGPNGSGKTTILESIQYALTEKLPAGTNSGQYFLNEPKMSNRNLTKGTIEIKFSDAEGNILTVKKVMQVQMDNEGTLSFHKLGTSIDTGISDVQYTSADANSFCCSSINLSKSIINNVLFCHQENSLWPLDGRKELKEKFDEIFDAVRYNKCINHIREKIKNQQGTITMCEKELEGRQEKKEAVDQKRAKLEDKVVKLNQIQNSIEEKINEMKPLDERMKKILELEELLGTLQRKLTGKDEEKKGLVNQQKLLLKDISYVFEGTDEELQSKITSFKDEQSSEENAIKKLEMSIQSLYGDIDVANHNIEKKQVQIGQMNEEQNQYNKRKEESNKLIDNLRTELNLVENFEDQESLLRELSNALKMFQSGFNELKKEKDAEENELQSQIDTLREKNAKTEQIIASKNGFIKENEAKSKEIQCKLEELDTSDSQMRNITGKIESLQSDISKIKNSFDENKKMREIQDLKNQIESKEQYLEKLEQENRILQRNYATEQSIETQRNMIQQKQDQINRIKTKHSSHFVKLFSDALPEINLKQSVLNIQNTQEVELKKTTTSINSLEKQIATLETTLKHSKDQLKIRQQDLSTKQQKVAELCKGRDFYTVLVETYEKKEKLQKDKGHYRAEEIMYKAFIDKFEEKNCCPVCKTDFKDNRTAIPEIIRELKRKIDQIPSALVKVESELKKEEAFYNKLQQLKTINDAIQNLTEEIPEFEKKIGTLDEEFIEQSMSLTDLKQQQEQPQRIIEICKTIITDATLFDQYNTDIRSANATIQVLEESIERVPSNRSRMETESEINAVKGQLSTAKNGYETNKNMLESHKERIQELNKKIQNEVQRQLDIQKLVQEKPLLETQYTDINKKLVVLKIEVEELKVNISSQKQELKEAIEAKTKATITNNQIKEAARNKLNLHQNGLSDIHKLLKSIREYEINQNKDKLKKALEELAELKVYLETHKKIMTISLESVSKKKESLAKRPSEFRALTDNVTLRELQNKQTKVEAEIGELRQKIEEANYQQVYEERQRKADEINKKQREIDSLLGQQEEVQAQIDELTDELNKDDNRNAHNLYKIAYYDLTLNKLVKEDLTKYVKRLEKSLLKFHEERMVQINTSIRKLWRTIYRGNDIDYIEIKTLDDSRPTRSTDDTLAAGKRRSYDYEVVQVKNGIKLDMRGRCSAGQKVLACLVVRMALAETFSSHCGILALDEPTTNLDKENISSLSDALSELITSRENQTNFQLLIITHDEEFLRSITQMQSLDSYWQIKRNHEGSSTVEKVILY
ncbi:DNA repair protein RAD50-like [Diabrotica virgifera virgifera]|uniref:Zinc-hook domain-containing protein n=2 Tax=Diabrotica virgifera virgifera TaxID=50390 RepID=A0ABM5KF42_DIAVI|nr:DNA repair protein RAD50-like [Diabrotica virgifera virgifera]XP_050508806.1 DNA repair protein RAD50-like [Diabrotica virgifera virgifera]XP_050508807.1 DNA repair protein RAD50-like [Diabrotica virgifera virgifera]